MGAIGTGGGHDTFLLSIVGLLVGVYSQTEVFPSYLLHTVSLASLRASHVEVLRGKANYQNSLETSTDEPLAPHCFASIAPPPPALSSTTSF